MTTPYVHIINGYALGDLLSVIFADVYAQRAGIDLWWLAHQCDTAGPPDYVSYGRLHVPMFRLYWRAGLFEKLIVMPQANASNYLDAPRLKDYEAYARSVYGRSYDRPFQSMWDCPEFQVLGKPCDMSAELRDRFGFLLCNMGEAYGTCQVASATLNEKCLTIGKAREHLSRFAKEYNPAAIYFIGVISDWAKTQRVIDALADELNPVKLVNLCGERSIEATFRLLYNTRFHVGCESFSPLFTCQLGIPTVKVFLPFTTARQAFGEHFSALACFTCDTDHDVVIGGAA